MMKKRLCLHLLMTFLLMTSLSAAENNLLVNTNFDLAPDGSIWDWNSNHSIDPGAVTLVKGAGYEGSNAVRIRSGKGYGISQGYMKLIPGEKYRVSAYVRTRGLSGARTGLLITDWGWNHEYGVKSLPGDASQWTLVEAEFSPKPSANGLYGFIGGIIGNSQGELEICLPKIEPLSEKAKSHSESLFHWSDDHRLVPVAPLLHSVPAERAAMKFFVTGRYPQQPDQYMARVSLMRPDKETWTVKENIPVKNSCFTADFGEQTPRESWIKAELIDPSSGKVLQADGYPLVIIKALQNTPGKKLNVQVTELYNGPVSADKPLELTFNESCWLFLSLTPANAGASGNFDGKPVLVYRDGEAQETFVKAERGNHKLTVAGVSDGAKLIVRRIPELLNFPRNVDPQNDLARFKYDMDFHKKYIFPASCVLSQHSTGESQKCINERGIMNIRSGGMAQDIWLDPIRAKAEISRWWLEPTISGRILDELRSSNYFECRTLDKVLQDLLDFDKMIYIYLEGHSYITMPMTQTALISSLANASRGRGKLVVETYVRTRPGAEGWKPDIKNYIDDTLGWMRNCTDEVNSKVILLSSGFLTAGRFDCNAYPDCDFKYMQDKFYQRVATDPSLAGIGGVGIYCFGHCDEELVRWLFTLQRHYFVEGRTDLLSDSYGYKYQPGMLKNCDFKERLDHWQAKGKIKATRFAGLGKLYQVRRNPADDSANGDSAAQFRRGKEPNVLSQTATGLVPGQLYSIKYVSCDGQDLQSHKDTPPCVMNLRFNPNEAEVIPELGYLHRYNGKAMMNTHRYVFKALKPEVTITFCDWQDDQTPGAPENQIQLVNFVNLTPYFPEK